MSNIDDESADGWTKNCVIHKIEHRSPGMACTDFKPYTEKRFVRVMATAEGYAMVRRKGFIPYVAPMNELFPPANTSE